MKLSKSKTMYFDCLNKVLLFLFSLIVNVTFHFLLFCVVYSLGPYFGDIFARAYFHNLLQTMPMMDVLVLIFTSFVQKRSYMFVHVL